MMIFSANMVGRLVVNGQLRWRGQWQLATIATAEEGDGGKVNGGGGWGGGRTGCELIHLSAAEGYGRRQQRRQVDSGAGR